MTASTKGAKPATTRPQPQVLTMKHTGQTNGGTDKFGEYDREQTTNLTGYVTAAQMKEWREANGGKSVVGLRVAVSPVYEGDE